MVSVRSMTLGSKIIPELPGKPQNQPEIIKVLWGQNWEFGFGCSFLRLVFLKIPF